MCIHAANHVHVLIRIEGKREGGKKGDGRKMERSGEEMRGEDR